MSATIRLDVITSSKVAYSGEVKMVIARALDGDVGVLPGHVPMVVALDIWPLRIVTVEKEIKMAVSGGIMSVEDNRITVMTATAESEEAIDVDRAKAALARAEGNLSKAVEYSEQLVWKNARKRAEVRLAIAKSRH